MQYSKTVLTHLRSVVIIKRGGDLQHSEDFYIKHIFLGGVEMSKLFKKKFFCLFLLVILAVSIATPFTSVFAAESYMIGDTQINVYELINCQNILRAKANPAFTISDYKLLYGLDNEDSYIAVYDDSLNYFAVYNRDAGIIMERGEGENPYSEFCDKKCYYGGYSCYYYESSDEIIDILTNENYDKTETLNANFNTAREIMERSTEISQFSDRNQIISLNKQNQNNVVRLNSANNISNIPLIMFLYAAVIISNCQYLSLEGEYFGQYINLSDGSVGRHIGYQEFWKYNGTPYYDTIHPINVDNECGPVAATIFLQYYERMGIENTVPEQIYNMGASSFENGHTYLDTVIVSEIIKDKIRSFENDIFGLSTYVSLKDAINDYFEYYGITGMSASSSVLTSNMKETLDNEEPCIIFSMFNTVKSTNLEQNGFETQYINGHVMFCYGYTTIGDSNSFDELVCHSGWQSTNCYAGYSYISAVSVIGNVRLLH